MQRGCTGRPRSVDGDTKSVSLGARGGSPGGCRPGVQDRSAGIHNRRGRVSAHTSGGSISVRETTGAVDASTSGGSVSAYLSAQPNEPSQFKETVESRDITKLASSSRRYDSYCVKIAGLNNLEPHGRAIWSGHWFLPGPGSYLSQA